LSCSLGATEDWDGRRTLPQARINSNYADALYLAGAAAAVLPTPLLDPAFLAEGAPPPPPEDGREFRLIRRPPEGWPPGHYQVGKGRVPSGTTGGEVDGHEAYLPLARECLAGGLGGLILSGGGDVGADPLDKPGLQPELSAQDKARDRWEAALFAAALELDLPVLGVCRGLQLMNVARGGTLWEDIGAQVEGALDHRQRSPRARHGHAVRLAPGSLAARLSGAEELQVNSGHHQAVCLAGEGLEVTGVSPDGLCEALELPGRAFVLGVQWHPEGLARSDPRALALFRGLAAAARERLAAGPPGGEARGG
jgi:putative glutamine amidotransferase